MHGFTENVETDPLRIVMCADYPVKCDNISEEVKKDLDTWWDVFKKPGISLSLPLFPFVRGEVMPATFSLPHLLVFSTLLCLVSSSSSLPPLLPSSHISLHSPPISALASLVSSCPALVTLPLSSVIGYRPSFLRVSSPVCSRYSCYFSDPVVFAHLQPLLL